MADGKIINIETLNVTVNVIAGDHGTQFNVNAQTETIKENIKAMKDILSRKRTH